MPDREKVLFALDCYAEQRVTCSDECPYFTRIAVGFGGHGYGYCAKTNIARDAIALIKQKPVKPTVDARDGWYRCGNCGNSLASGERARSFGTSKYPVYCECCGKKVDWDA